MTVSCEYCGKQFEKPNQLNGHLTRMHKYGMHSGKQAPAPLPNHPIQNTQAQAPMPQPSIQQPMLQPIAQAPQPQQYAQGPPIVYHADEDLSNVPYDPELDPPSFMMEQFDNPNLINTMRVNWRKDQMRKKQNAVLQQEEQEGAERQRQLAEQQAAFSQQQAVLANAQAQQRAQQMGQQLPPPPPGYRYVNQPAPQAPPPPPEQGSLVISLLDRATKMFENYMANKTAAAIPTTPDFTKLIGERVVARFADTLSTESGKMMGRGIGKDSANRVKQERDLYANQPADEADNINDIAMSEAASAVVDRMREEAARAKQINDESAEVLATMKKIANTTQPQLEYVGDDEHIV